MQPAQERTMVTHLTEREAELTALLAHGYTNDELCSRLRISCPELAAELDRLARKVRWSFSTRSTA